jgi:hypothetical protein
MKRLLLLLLLAPAVVSAQNFEIGLDAGVTVHARPMKNIYTTQDKEKAGFAALGKVSLLLPHTQIGIGVEATSITETNALISPYTSSETNYLAKPLIVPHAFYNFVHYNDQNYIYAGVMLGLAVASLGVNTYEYSSPSGGYITGYTTAYNSALGIAAGLQAGFVTCFGKSKKVGINVQAALRYVDYNYTDPTTTLTDNPYHYRYIYLPFTAGVRYRI